MQSALITQPTYLDNRLGTDFARQVRLPFPASQQANSSVRLSNLIRRFLQPRRPGLDGRAKRSRRSRAPRLLLEPLESRELLTILPAGFQETLYGGTNVNPAGFDFGPDGRMFIANKDGRVTIIEADGTPAPAPFFSVPVDTFRDRGLTAVVVDPHYEQNHYVYVY